MRAFFSLLLCASACCHAFVAPSSASTTATGGAPARAADDACRAPRAAFPSSSTSITSLASSAAAPSAADTDAAGYRFANYDKPVVLVGSSSSPEASELRRLAVSLSGALAGNSAPRLRSTLDGLQRSLSVGLLGESGPGCDDELGLGCDGEETEAPDVEGISLSPLGVDDEEGPFVFDTNLLRREISRRSLTLSSGVLVLDFNDAVLAACAEHEREALADSLRDMIKELYKQEGILSVYVNVRPDGLSEEAKQLEQEVFIPYSDYELCIKDEGTRAATEGESSWEDMELELQRIVAQALLPPPVVGETGTANSADIVMGLNTFFLSLTFPRVDEAAPYVEAMCQDIDAMEYRVDLLRASRDYLAGNTDAGRFDILYQSQRLRAMCRPHSQRAPALPFAGSSVIDDAFPIVYTVRTANQAGTFPDDEEGIAKMFELLELGLRSAPEVLDVESAWDPELTTRLLDKHRERYTSLILGSHHVVGTQVSADEAVELYRRCRIQERAHGAKVVLSILSNDDDEDRLAYDASLIASRDKPQIPSIGLVLGEVGSYSRILNPRYTPVTHECLPSAAAPGQLTAAEIMAGRLFDGRIPVERYAILGHNIAYSVSPQMQGGAFAAVKLPHSYTRADVETVEEFVEGPLWNDDNFGGCSVTIPHKQAIIPHLDVLTDAAKEIGSVNTVIVKKDKKGTRVLIGENTDWKGMYNPLQRKIGESIAKTQKDDPKTKQYALILGGGGTARAAAYTAARLGLERIYWGRTREKSEDLAREFGGVVASNLNDDPDDKESLGAILAENKGGSIRAVISTIPKTAEFTLPEWLLEDASSLPVVLDVNYKPYNTPLLLQAVEKGCDVVRGSEMLWEQGVGQFELWTGRKAPYGVMKKVVLENCLPKYGEEE